jgi:enoyl-[acyl-carrier protein] reductase I
MSPPLIMNAHPATIDAIENRTFDSISSPDCDCVGPREDLQGRLTDCSQEGFLRAMDVSCHSFMRMARLAEPLMRDGGALFTLSYYDTEYEHYKVMGPATAALESAVRYLAYELGPLGT